MGDPVGPSPKPSSALLGEPADHGATPSRLSATFIPDSPTPVSPCADSTFVALVTLAVLLRSQGKARRMT
jgi:hypothetical protein